VITALLFSDSVAATRKVIHTYNNPDVVPLSHSVECSRCFEPYLHIPRYVGGRSDVIAKCKII